MQRGRHALFISALAVSLVALWSGQAVQAQGWSTSADYQLNEARGATTLVDSGGRGLNGTIGNKVELAQRSGSATYHKFPYVSSSAPSDPGRTHLVPSNAALNPGTGSFAMEVRFRTTVNDGNIIQKGQSGGGGMWKMELHNGGYGACVFQGTSASVGMSSDAKITDGQWHVLRCERTSTSASLYVDGVLQTNPRVATGDIQSTWEVSIGGKSRCASAGVECDYYRGDLDYVRIERGGTTPPTTTTTTTTIKPTTTTTTVKPTTTTTTTAPPSSQLPVGRIESIVVDGSTITVGGPASDPNGTPVARLTDVVDGRTTVIERSVAQGRFTFSYTGATGTHQVCVSLLDSPTRQAVPIGCGEAVVK
jgi:hypothetical protein